ncbi:SDR family NAD(P)-dependent oxidoreductase [Streptomyces durbertensis]|uniref:SDR family NAD(P)-dependent oxidoreductase n=1 Tax=Streptomyces durbertensis TaxID=2448886 RepID=A0ABR6EAS2_9ACTN|nr:SDR family NAD(P)-dependent oxidoreductase [Streptomyces durbertensis]
MEAAADADELLTAKHEPIAVVGIGLRFPGGCDSPEEFDALLRDGVSGISPLPEDRWDVERFSPSDPASPDPEEKGRIRTTGGGFLDRIDLFDAPFFNISPKEAQYIDPQQRMVLETAWKALEHANIDPSASRRGNGGVYIGASSIDYALELDALPYEQLDGHLASGITMFPLSGRLSYFLGWRGPSVSVDTACSSSLAALHMAVQGLRNRETDIALCGGVNALHHPRIPVMFSHANMLAPDGQCKTFDEAADGYVRAEGCGIIVLKRLTDAVRDGDRVLAVVRGTAVGQDGDSAGLTVPNGVAQEEVMRRAMAAALLGPADIQYVEAHGTGTPLGDPIELGAINDAFAPGHDGDNPLLVGSVKTNLGHMEPASGIVGVIKAVLQLRSGTIYPHLNLNNPSGRIPWDVYAVKVPTECTPYPPGVRRALVNSFGFAGTIGAAVLEQAPEVGAGEPRATEVPAPPKLFTVSAKSEPALVGQLENYRAFLDDRPDVDLDALCFTAHVGRAHFPHRLAAPVADADGLRAFLDAELARERRPQSSRIRRTAFLFTGQGSQYPGMGAALYARHPEFREQVDVCDRLFADHLDFSVRELVTDRDVPVELLARTSHTQPALFTLEYALARLWMSWGVRPQALIGHSIGEVTAAAVAGVLDLPDAVRLVAVRSRLMQSVRARGGMAAVGASAADIEPLLADHPGLALAAVNAPDQCVVSGDSDALDDLCAKLTADGLRVDRLTVSHAFHSPQMAEVYDEFRAELADLTFHAPQITLFSNVTGKAARLSDIGNVDYWVRHIGEPVRFMDGVRALAKRGRHALVEVGPATALTALAKRCLPVEDHLWLPSLHRKDTTGDTLVRALADYYAAGLAVDWSGYHRGHDPGRVTLPNYAFQRRRHWLPVGKPGAAGAGSASGPVHHPLLGAERAREDGLREDGVREFTTVCGAQQLGALRGLRTAEGPELPVAGWVELLLALADAVHGHTRVVLRELLVTAALPLPEESDTAATVELRTRLEPLPDGRARVEVVSVAADEETRHVTALLEPTTAAAEHLVQPPTPDGDQHDAVRWTPAEDVYTDLTGAGQDVGDALRSLRRAGRLPDGTLLGELDTEPAGGLQQLPLPVLEGALHTLTVDHPDAPALRPVGFAAVRLHKKPRGHRLTVAATVTAAGPEAAHADDGRVVERTADVTLWDGDEPVAELTGVRLARAAQAPSAGRHFLHRQRWLRRTAPPTGTADGQRHALALVPPCVDADTLTVSAERAGIRLTATTELGDAPLDASVTDVCWFWHHGAGDDADVSGGAADRLRAECAHNYRSLLATVAALDATGRSPRLWLVTERAQLLPGDTPGEGDRLAAATLWGFGHTLLNEYPHLRVTLLDLPGGPPTGLVDELLAGELDEERGEFQVAHRDGRRHVRRLLAGDRSPAFPGGYAVHAAEGSAAAPDVVPAPEPDLADGELAVAVHSAAVTADDARRAAEEPGAPLGGGAYGTVTAVAPGVEGGPAVGDRVLVHAEGALRRTLTVRASDVVPAPEGLTAAAAALAAARTAGAGATTEPVSLDELDEALRLLAREDGPAAVPVLLPEAGAAPPTGPRVRDDRLYVVTGGLGGLGLVTARALVDNGARHLALVSRSGRPTPEAAEVLAELSERATVHLPRADVGRAADVARLFGELKELGVPVGGLVHAAGAIGKQLVSALTWEEIDEQFGPKVYGGWLLHEATAKLPELDFFVCYSSIASVIGGATQAHYAGASAFLDALTEWRAASGLPATAANWGAWASVGMSARLDDNLGKEIVRGGIQFFSPTRALRALDGMIGGGAVRRVVGEVDWRRYTDATPVDNRLYERLVGAGGSDEDGEAAVDVAELLKLPARERGEQITALVAGKVGAALRMGPDDPLDHDAKFVSLGLDSLMGMEVRSGLEKALGLSLPASLAFDHPSVRELSDFLHGRLVPQEAAA